MLPQAIARADAVVEDSYWEETAEQLTPLIQQHPEQFQLLYISDGAKPTRLYKIVRNAGALPTVEGRIMKYEL